MGIKYADLATMSDEELIKKHDERQTGTLMRADFYLEVLHRRKMRRHTKVITWLTAAVTAMTAINVGIVAGFW